jgi:diketogulonate reductase-like aldo/keto reductase
VLPSEDRATEVPCLATPPAPVPTNLLPCWLHTPPLRVNERVAKDKGATPAQIALAWLLAQRQYIVPIPGTTKVHRLEENIGAVDVSLTADDLRKINDAASNIRAEGERYAPAALAMAGRDAPEKREAP